MYFTAVQRGIKILQKVMGVRVNQGSCLHLEHLGWWARPSVGGIQRLPVLSGGDNDSFEAGE
jgi:hypothetical protein